MESKRIRISSKLYDYSVEFVCGFEKELDNFGDATTYIIDKNVYKLYEKKLKKIDRDNIYFMDAEESKKNMDTVMEIIYFWKSIHVKKNWTVVCIGGGIVQDVTTIASNLYLRNIQWYFFPTTLLSMCDSCIGGKCGINLGEFKNQIGVFYPPQKIFIDIHFIETLSHGDYLNGWGELLKFSLTNDVNFYNRLKSEKKYIPCESIDEYIYRGLNVKKSIIEEDEFESDLRRILNYGHTFGHALEAYTHNQIPHGKGVIWGIDVVNFIAWKKELITEEYYYDVKNLIKRAFLPNEIRIQEPDKLFEIIKTDKKVSNNTLNFAMLNAPSHLIVYPIYIDEELYKLFINYLEDTDDYYCN